MLRGIGHQPHLYAKLQEAEMHLSILRIKSYVTLKSELGGKRQVWKVLIFRMSEGVDR